MSQLHRLCNDSSVNFLTLGPSKKRDDNLSIHGTDGYKTLIFTTIRVAFGESTKGGCGGTLSCGSNLGLFTK